MDYVALESTSITKRNLVCAMAPRMCMHRFFRPKIKYLVSGAVGDRKVKLWKTCAPPPLQIEF